MEAADFARMLHSLGASHQTRRAALRRLGLGGVAAGLLTAADVRSGRAQTWEEATPSPGQAETAPANTPFAGVTGGLPPFGYPLAESIPVHYEAGSVQWATSHQFPALRGVALASQRIAPRGLRELHWHLNANELSYCLSGQGRIGIFAPDGTGDTFAIRPGSISFVPNGFTHYIQNTGEDELHLIVAFNDEAPATMNFSTALPGIPAPLLGETFGVTGSDVPFLTALGDRVIVPIPAQPESTTAATPIVAASSPYTVQVDDIPVSQFAGGTVQPLGTQQIPPLAGITVFPLQAVPFGLREPHWHPNTSELNYCVSGRAQIGVVAPDGNVQTFAVEPGSIAFIPDNWFHYIANISDESLQFLIFFVGPESRVRTINLSQTFDFFPPEVLAASVGVDPERFAALPKRGNVVIAPPVATD